jgi:DNA-binding CsgD family transcriptional regulator
MNLTHAAAVLATEDDAEIRFRAAVRAGSATWPHEHHRLLLAFGSWLRRRHRVQESRGYLRAARDGFDDLGSAPWAARARDELRITGEQSHVRERDVADELSPQEAQIAALVADGLSNREIGERLFLSHRTVGSHLYRMFPKLGVHSRVELVRLVAERGPRDA